MIREKIIPVLWLLAAAIIVGCSIGFSARANASPPGCVYPDADWRNGCDYDYQPDGSHMRCEITVAIVAFENCFPVPPAASIDVPALNGTVLR